MKRAYGYTRISYRDLKNKRNSIDEQKERIVNYCKLNGIELADTFNDFLPPHKDMLDILIARCRQEDSPEVVVVTAWNRIGKNKYFKNQMIESFAKKGIKLVVLDELNDKYKETKDTKNL